MRSTHDLKIGLSLILRIQRWHYCSVHIYIMRLKPIFKPGADLIKPF